MEHMSPFVSNVNEDQFRKDIKAFSNNKYDKVYFENTTKAERKKVYLDLMLDYIKTDLLFMKEEQENNKNTASIFLKKLADFVSLL